MIEIIGHRGAKGQVFENSFQSFNLAFSLGIKLFEVDIQLTKDNIPVVFHDANLDRCTNSKGFVKDYNYEYLHSKVTLNNFEKIPTLVELCELVKNRNQKVILELKNPLALLPVYETIKNYDKSNFIISSFFHHPLLEIKNIDPLILTSAIFECYPIDIKKFLQKTECDIASIGIETSSKELVAEIKAMGLKCYGWTVNTFDDYKYCLDIGLDGVYINDPEKVNKTAANSGLAILGQTQ